MRRETWFPMIASPGLVLESAQHDNVHSYRWLEALMISALNDRVELFNRVVITSPLDARSPASCFASLSAHSNRSWNRRSRIALFLLSARE